MGSLNEIEFRNYNTIYKKCLTFLGGYSEYVLDLSITENSGEITVFIRMNTERFHVRKGCCTVKLHGILGYTGISSLEILDIYKGSMFNINEDNVDFKNRVCGLVNYVLSVCSDRIPYPVHEINFIGRQLKSCKKEIENGECDISVCTLEDNMNKISDLLKDQKLCNLEGLIKLHSLLDDRGIREDIKESFRDSLEKDIKSLSLNYVSMEEVLDGETVILMKSGSSGGYSRSGTNHSYYLAFRTQVRKLGIFSGIEEGVGDWASDSLIKIEVSGETFSVGYDDSSLYSNNKDILYLSDKARKSKNFIRVGDLFKAYKKMLIEKADNYGLYIK